MKVLTLTLNPAFDLHCYAPTLQLGVEQFAERIGYDAGGKGINLSRALLVEQIPTRTLVLVGEENKEAYLSMLNKDGLVVEAVGVPGCIRENITIHHDGKEETRISFKGFCAQEEHLGEIAYLAMDDDLFDAYITLNGSNPPGIDKKMVIALLLSLKERGGKIVIDSKSFSVEDYMRMKPFLIKPNQNELSQIVGYPVNTIESAKRAAEELHDRGVERIMVSLGASGALLVSGNGSFYVDAPSVKPVSTIGAGDSMIAGFLAGIYAGDDDCKALKRAVAYGTASCMTQGTRPPQKESIDLLLESINS